MNIENEGAADSFFEIFEILHFKMEKWTDMEVVSKRGRLAQPQNHHFFKERAQGKF